MSEKVVIALGGNALGHDLESQRIAVKSTAKAIVDLIEAGNKVVITHGNGPQVGMLNNVFADYKKMNPNFQDMPLSMCVAMSQAYIGYDLQNAIREELLNRKIEKSVVSVITQVVVDENDKAFSNPTKPIGPFMTEEEAEIAKGKGMDVVEDAGRGYRRVVASPKPVEIVEIESIRRLVDADSVVIACGGGGIPVVSKGNVLEGKGAVIDKDFASSVLAQQLDADKLVVLTAVEKVAINFGKEDETWLSKMSVEEAKEYSDRGEFAPGSMLPKVQAAIDFANSRDNRESLITSLEKASEGLKGNTGTKIYK
ncbi:carbamate kinase [Lagierella sp.]|uniref:carbamate kinase n=1 Tax=Lagierella sp. TaxID=2849657 RepID=UPI0026313E97|nr:carbamate kinase [Lagierella sp.]